MKRALPFAALLYVLAGCSDPSSAASGTTNAGTPPAETGKETPATTTTASQDSTQAKMDPSIIGGKYELGDAKPLDGEEIAVIDTKQGEILLRFYNDLAPNHVKNFKTLAKKGFYDGTTFHRVIPTFMIQGGDPNSKDGDPTNDGQGDPGYTVDAEFSKAEHKRGILSMARAQDPNSAGSQFFIVQADHPDLDNNYTVFGRVVHSGKEKPGEEPDSLKVVDKIVNVNRDSADRPTENVTMKVKIVKWPDMKPLK